MPSVSVFVLQCEIFSTRDALVAWQIGMNANKFAEEAFRMDSRIRYVAIVDRQFHVLVSRMREGVASITPEEDDRHFVQLIPPILLDAVEKLTPLLGNSGVGDCEIRKGPSRIFHKGELCGCSELQSYCDKTVHECTHRNNAITGLSVPNRLKERTVRDAYAMRVEPQKRRITFQQNDKRHSDSLHLVLMMHVLRVPLLLSLLQEHDYREDS